MQNKLFGTDGIRGTANVEPMTAATALKVGMAAGFLCTRGKHRHRVVIGKDTRLSGYMIEPALTSGLVSAGVDSILVGPMPTPAVAMLTRSLRADLGVMISASHNSYEDNGIKIFGPDGYKISDEMESIIEERINNEMSFDLVSPRDLGRALRLDDAQGRYIEFAKQTFPKGQTLEGLKVVIDCANGAAYKVAPTVLQELGAEVVPLGVTPDGININKGCGSTYTELMTDCVVASGADVGIALDGDADRLLIADENGELVDGDLIIGVIAASWKKENRLTGKTVVATVMSNSALEDYLRDEGLTLQRVQVGDRYVVQRMRSGNCNLGGEQSGHIVLSDYSTTGDGLMAALQVLHIIQASGKPASQVCRPFEPRPQLLENVKLNIGDPLRADAVKQVIAESERRLLGKGRLLIRKSGTEPLVRIMAEGEDRTLIASVVNEIVREIERVV